MRFDPSDWRHMRNLAIGLALAAFLTGVAACQVHAQPSPPPGLTRFGAVTPNDCVKWHSNTQLADSGGTCGGGGGSVSITPADGLALVSPNPLTGTGTFGVNHNVSTAGNCVTWVSAIKLGDAGGPCATGGIAGQTVLTFSTTPVANPYGTECYPATGFTLAANTAYTFQAIVQRPNGTDAGLALNFDANNAIDLNWQSDNNFKLGYTVAGVTTQISSVAVSPPVASGTYQFALHVTTDAIQGLTVWGELKGLSTSTTGRPTSIPTVGTWQPCVLAGASSAQLRGTGIQSIGPF